MAGSLIQVALLIVNSLAGFFSVLLLLRFFMQAWRAPFNNQIGAFVLKLTNWLVVPLRRILPAIFGLDSASLLSAYLLQVLALAISVSLQSGIIPLSATDIVPLALAHGLLAVLRLCVYMLIGLLIAQAVLSWVNPYSPMSRPIGLMTEPILRPLRKLVPPISNIDLTPLIAILLAQVVLIFL